MIVSLTPAIPHTWPSRREGNARPFSRREGKGGRSWLIQPLLVRVSWDSLP